jgi:hypothetical protein
MVLGSWLSPVLAETLCDDVRIWAEILDIAILKSKALQSQLPLSSSLHIEPDKTAYL